MALIRSTFVDADDQARVGYVFGDGAEQAGGSAVQTFVAAA
jgi:hypothetical protein